MNEQEMEQTAQEAEFERYLMDDEETADQPEANQPAADQESGERTEEGAQEPPAGQETPEAGEEENEGSRETGETGETFELRHLEEVKSVGREEVISLAQKGMDYERVQQQRDQLAKENKGLLQAQGEYREAVELLKSIARERGTTPGEILREIRTRQLVDFYIEKGMDQNSAEIAAREREEREAAERKAKEPKPQENRWNREVREFLESYPKAPEKIPPEVFKRYEAGMSLKQAYESVVREEETRKVQEENERLKKELEAERQNQQNRRASIGSQQSVAGAKGRDIFADALLED